MNNNMYYYNIAVMSGIILNNKKVYAVKLWKKLVKMEPGRKFEYSDWLQIANEAGLSVGQVKLAVNNYCCFGYVDGHYKASGCKIAGCLKERTGRVPMPRDEYHMKKSKETRKKLLVFLYMKLVGRSCRDIYRVLGFGIMQQFELSTRFKKELNEGNFSLFELNPAVRVNDIWIERDIAIKRGNMKNKRRTNKLASNILAEGVYNVVLNKTCEALESLHVDYTLENPFKRNSRA